MLQYLWSKMIIDLNKDENRLYINVAPYQIAGEVTLTLVNQATNTEHPYTIIPTKITSRYITLSADSWNNLMVGMYEYKLEYNLSIVDQGFIKVVDSTEKIEVKTPQITKEEPKFYERRK